MIQQAPEWDIAFNAAQAKSQQFKADAGKAMPDLFEDGFGNAVRLMQATLEYGAQKYEAHSWRNVPDGISRYARAGGRHRQDRALDAQETGTESAILGSCDLESGLPHIAHELFNLMCQVELAIQKEAEDSGVSRKEITLALVANMKAPLQDHKLRVTA